MESEPKFKVGDQVRKRSSRDITGVVKKYSGLKQGGTHWYKIDFNGRKEKN